MSDQCSVGTPLSSRTGAQRLSYDDQMTEVATEQHRFLRAAMEELAPDRTAFAELIGVSKRSLDKWLYPYLPGRPKGEQDFRVMAEYARRLLVVLLERQDSREVVARFAPQRPPRVGKKRGRPARPPH